MVKSGEEIEEFVAAGRLYRKLREHCGRTMPLRNLGIIVFTLLLYGICSRFTLRDRILVESLHRIERVALVAPTSKQLYEGAMTGMTEVLYEQADEYSAFIPDAGQKEYNDELDNRFDGIGVVYEQETEDFTVIYPVLHSPALKAGIRSGDKIVKVNGTETKGLPFDEVSKLFAGNLGEDVPVTILPYGQTEPKDYNVPRVPVRRDSVVGDQTDADGKRIFLLETIPDIAYIRLTSFSEHSAEEMVNALSAVTGKAKGLILDLRGNPGGYIDQGVQIAQMFLKKKNEPQETSPVPDVIVSTRYRNGKQQNYHIESLEPLCTLPMAVLIDGGSASASEILAAALQDHHRAVIVGSRSFGKGCIQKIIPLPIHSGILSLTDASYWRPNGRNIHRSKDATDSDDWGVRPDPEGSTDISLQQQLAVRLIRERRSNTVSPSRQQILEDYIRCLPEKWKKFNDEKKEDEKESEPLVLQGQAPYYDPALDKAVEILQGGIAGLTQSGS